MAGLLKPFSNREISLMVDLSAIQHNARVIRRSIRSSGAQLIAMIKGDAYGHGAVSVARALRDAGVDWLFAGSLEEALRVRASVTEPRIIFPVHSLAPDLIDGVRNRLDFSISAVEALEYIERGAKSVGLPARIHLEVDVGLGRGGVVAGEFGKIATAVEEAKRRGTVLLVSIWTHLPSSSPETRDQMAGEVELLLEAVRELRRRSFIPLVHVVASSLTLSTPKLHFDMVRVGNAIYGIGEPDIIRSFGLLPVMSLSSRVIGTKEIRSGQGVSYEPRWVATENCNVALLPIGFANGIPRSISGRYQVGIAKKLYPGVGLITMNYSFVNCGCEVPRLGDWVTMIGRVGEVDLNLWNWSECTGTVPDELSVRLGQANEVTYA